MGRMILRMRPTLEEKLREPYWTILRFRGRGGVMVELDYELTSPPTVRAQWYWRYVGFEAWHGPAKSKIYALIQAAWACHRSAEAMDWMNEPPTPKPAPTHW